jgi:hypothetical protein
MMLSLVCFVAGLNITSQAAQGAEEGFVSLFNGKDLAGWHLEGVDKKAFAVEQGELRLTYDNLWPTWLRSDRTYENYVLRFEFKVGYYCETGLLINAPLHGPCARVGMKILLTEDTAPGAKTQHTGTIVGVAREKMLATKYFDQWNTVEVVMDYPVLRVTVNDKVVQEIDCSQNEKLRYRLRQGYIGLQGNASPAAFRNIRIKELPSKEKWIPLFNGKDLSNWQTIGKTTWKAVDGVIVGKGTPAATGYLLTRAEYQDFELFAYIRTTRQANGGIFFRWKTLGTDDRGNEIQIYNDPDGNNPTGSVYTVARTENLTARDGEWFPMHIFLKGNKCVVRVNGEMGGVTDQITTIRPGMVSLQMHTRGATIEFKDLRVKPLD